MAARHSFDYKTWRCVSHSISHGDARKIVIPIRVSELREMGFQKKDFPHLLFKTLAVDGKQIIFELKKKSILKRIFRRRK